MDSDRSLIVDRVSLQSLKIIPVKYNGTIISLCYES